MKLNSLTWLGIAGCFTGFTALVGACGSGENVSPSGGGTSICGNALVESGEDCDDGNSNDGDACSNACKTGGNTSGGGSATTSTATGMMNTCGNGKLDPGEVCDDGNDVDNDLCKNNCTSNAPTTCGNGVVDDGEQCDDGNKVADDNCTNLCTNPVCGDGIIQMGEDCDDGKNNGEFGSKCPTDCKNPVMTSSSSGNPCAGAKIYKDYVSNILVPKEKTGMGPTAKWSYNGIEGLNAGNAMCQAIGADHVCKYAEIVAADAAGELALVPANLTFWLHRTTSVPTNTNKACAVDSDCANGGGAGVPVCDGKTKVCSWKAGAGGRCNEWTYPTGHISDGEWFATSANQTNKAGGTPVGTMVYHFDGDTFYDGASGAHLCNTSNSQGCAGPCGTGVPRAILCCEATCK